MPMKYALILLTFMSSTALAQWNKIPSTDFAVAPPPKVKSAAEKKDFEILLKYQDSRTPEQCAMAGRQKWPNFSSFFGAYEGLSEAEFETLKKFMGRVGKLAERVTVYHKNHFERRRPYQVKPEIKPCVHKVEGSKSYPSSHASIAYTMGCVLGEFFPKRKAALIEYASDLGELRAIVGVHHPSDVSAGQELGQAVCDRLKSELDFVAEVKKLKAAL